MQEMELEGSTTMNIRPPRVWPSRRWIARAVAGLLLAASLAACGAQASPAAGPSPLTNVSQANEAGGVTIEATLLTQTPTITFKVALDTHSVELDGYDLRQLATLRVDQGPALQASTWDAPAGGHHREGTLTFPAATPDARAIELVIRDVGGVPERVLQWTR
jgi:hypothetical protein